MTTFNTSREIAASADEVFAAFGDPERLARWWGPAGFTNTFHVCEFETGGRWVYTMHSPHGGNPENESVFEQVEPPRKVVIRHISQPVYRLTIDLLPTAAGTLLSWWQEFDDAEVARRIEKVVVPANEQNLDRLTAEVLKLPKQSSMERRKQLLRFPNSVRRDHTIDLWMDEHSGELGAIARSWFEVMRGCGDDVRELLHDGHPTACVGDAAFGYVNAFTEHVNVGFFRGAEIADPDGLLEGTGRFMRHVKLRPERDVDAAALTRLIETAYTDIKRREAEIHE